MSKNRGRADLLRHVTKAMSQDPSTKSKLRLVTQHDPAPGTSAPIKITKAELDALVFEPVGTDGGSPKPVYVAIADLNIDETYQYHPLKEKNRLKDLKKWLAERGGFDEQEAGPIHVSRRKDGKLWNVDGGGRAKMAELAGLTKILAIIKEGMTWEDEANLFLAKNTKKRTIRKPHLFVVAANAGHEPEATILRMASERGYVIERSTETRKAALMAPSAFVFAHTLGTEVFLHAMLDLRHSWADDVDGRALVAVSAIIAAHPKIDHQRLREVLRDKENTFSTLVAAAREKAHAQFRSRSSQSRDLNPYLAYQIIGRYNYRKAMVGSTRLDPRRLDDLRSRFEFEDQYKEVWRWGF